MNSLRNDKTKAHVLPLAVFMLIVIPYALTGWPEWNHPSAPWWRHYPEQWIYPLQTVVAGGLLIFFWRNYELKWSRSVFLGVIMGVIGIGFWILPTQIYTWMDLKEEPSGYLKYLGVMPRNDGFNPQDLADEFGGSMWVYWGALLMRFFRAVVVVALIEEIFWRGFLMRFLLDPDRDYWKVPFGKASVKSYFIVTGAFMIAHAPVDYLGAFIFGSLMYWLAVRTKSLLACVVMHGTANLLMGWYALAFSKYGLW